MNTAVALADLDYVEDSPMEVMSDEIPRTTPDVLLQIIRNNDEKHVGGHNRLRNTLVELGATITLLDGKLSEAIKLQSLFVAKMDGFERRKVEVTSLRFTPSTLIGALVLLGSIMLGGQKWATSGVAEQQAKTQSSIDLLRAELNAQKQHDEDLAKLADVRAEAQAREILRISGQVTMVDTKVGNIALNQRKAP